MEQISRFRRTKKCINLRRMIEQVNLNPKDLIAPLFVRDGQGIAEEIKSMPGIMRLTIDKLVEEVKFLNSLGIPCVSLFPVIDESLKTSNAKEALNPDGLNQRAIKEIKNAVPEMVVMTDVALDPYSSDGHDGLLDKFTGKILNDETVQLLSKMALVQAKAGSDIIGPSDMMDGRVLAIRELLELEGYNDTIIMSYTAKYASSFYGPFRDALDSAPRLGDKKTYQMDYKNSNEALEKMERDILEGADIVMVKPGLAYLDVVRNFRENTNYPIAVYNVSGEYAMLKAADQNGWLNGTACMLEMLYGFKRAGADMILSYFAREFSEYYNS